VGDSAHRGELVAVGTGIKLVVQTTLEALDCIKRADKLFHLAMEPTEVWLRGLNPSAETLRDCYAPGKPRERSYAQMVQRILVAVRSGAYVCAAFYGHPGVFVNPAHDAIRRARREGFAARMLPGISAEDCLFADLGVDPVDSGCQSFEATDFLAYKRRFDPTSTLILWQAGLLGEPSLPQMAGSRPERLKRLTAVLRRHYDARHPVVLYEAAQFPTCPPRVKRIPLDRLPATEVWPMMTLYIRPKRSREADPAIMDWFYER
jgi:precorrin-3B methylase